MKLILLLLLLLLNSVGVDVLYVNLYDGNVNLSHALVNNGYAIPDSDYGGSVDRSVPTAPSMTTSDISSSDVMEYTCPG